MHFDDGDSQIAGTTDTTNAPMVAPFRRAGYKLTVTGVVVFAQTNDPPAFLLVDVENSIWLKTLKCWGGF
ncbi:hypothetical protein [Arthrobacter sp. MYb213]|uniref:hypothetical protein n=1 Tax=Arthrobacter sp. MYb213 TaxID=1848595 RepID=UPI000CFD0390|nr:hypothetical protein [Arthrobacter sp. MYb213]PRB72801.1 hypothetical protein CQ011_04030 [Arthrobacter sp. MYb213]